MTGETWALLAVAPVLVWAVVLGVSRVRRLDRLHVRVDAARAGLEAALVRRAEAALLVADANPIDVAPHPPTSHPAGGVRGSTTGCEVSANPPGAALRLAVLVARDAGAGDREAAENALGRLLAALGRAAVPEPVRSELAEAEQLLALARRVHNDAVRDTLGLRSRRMVRLLHLAGTAPLPSYFEIADPVAGPDVTTAAPVAARDGRGGVRA